MIINPINNYVLLQLEKPKSETDSGLFLVKSKQEKKYGVVVNYDKNIKGIQIGDKLLFNFNRSVSITIDKDDYILVKDEDILGKIND